MATNIRINQSLSVDGGRTISGSRTESGGTLAQLDLTLPASTTDSTVTVTFNSADVQGVCLYSEKNLTIETNASAGSAVGNTISLKAGSPLVWSKSDAYFTNPFSGGNVTAFYLTCSESTRFQAQILTT